MSLAEVLQQAHSADISIRAPAEQKLKAFEQKDLAAYLNALCQELADEKKALEIRQLAGLQIKNSIVAKDEQQRQHLASRWMLISDDTRKNIKNMLLVTLGSQQKAVRSTASLVVSKIAAIEIPQKQWGDLVGIIVRNVQQTGPNVAALRESSFETLGYLCEVIPNLLRPQSTQILSAISTGMKPDEPNNAIKFAATTALANSLDFAKENMANPEHRGLIMTMIFNAATCSEVKVRVAAYQCFVECASSYYQYLAPYIEAILKLTKAALQKEHDDVVLQAIEFWSSVCDEEIELIGEQKDAQEKGQKPKRQCQNFMNWASKELVPLILNCLTKQSENLDDDTWNVAMAAGTCLGLVAQATGDGVTVHVLPFVANHIKAKEWRYKEAATLAFGCILEGPSQEKLGALVGQVFGVILDLMTDKHPLVKDTAAWTIGRICSLVPEVVTESVLPRLMNTLVAGLSESPKIASNVCWAIHNLADAVDFPDDAKTSPMSKYFQGLMVALFKATDRTDVYEANLISSAYEAINELIQHAAPDQIQLIGSLIPTLIGRLRATLSQQGLTGNEKEKQNEVQALLCGSLQVVIQKVAKTTAIGFADPLMMLFLQVLQSKNATVHEEALMAIGAVANLTEKGFDKYMPMFSQYLIAGLKNAQEYNVCHVAVGVVGDLARALEEKLIPHCDEIMQLLLQNLQNPSIERSIKPQIISCLGDIALGVGGHFERYLPYAMMMLVQASQTKFENMDPDNSDYLHTLRESVLEAYTGILQGLNADRKGNCFLPFVENVMAFIDLVGRDMARDKVDSVIRAAVGLIGDIASRLGSNPNVVQLLKRHSIQVLINAAADSENDATSEAGDFAKKAVAPFVGTAS